MGYMHIAAKHTAKAHKKAKKDVENAADAKQPGDLLEDQVDTKAPSKKLLNGLQPKNKIAKPVNQKGVRTLPSKNYPVPGTPYAALADLTKKR